MATRPSTARSEISSAISDDGISTGPRSPAVNQQPALSNPLVTQHGYSHNSGSATSTDRSVRSPPPLSTTPNSSSRPTSPGSRASGTHIPSITAQGFLRPMSSRRLQAQRLGRTSLLRRSVERPPSVQDDAHETDDGRSITSSRQGPYAPMPRGHRATPSITSYSESQGAGGYEAGYRGRAPDAEQHGGGGNPTTQNRRTQPPTALNLNEPIRVGSIREDVQSPRSLSSGLGLGSRHIFEPGHQHLSSAASTPRHDPKPLTLSSGKSLGKNHEYFEGNTIFWLGGRIQNSRDRPINVGTGIVIVVPTILFLVFSSSYLWHHVSPALPVVFAYLFFICFSSFLHASLVDPGILPRNVHPFPPDSDDPLAVGPPTNDWVMVRLATSETAAMDVPVKYCKTCNIWRPPRCYHCRVCDNCVETLDHHCVWLNNCVGRRNYRYFFTFVSSGTLLALLLAFASLGHILAYRNQERVTLSHSVNVNRVPLAMFVYGILAAAYPISLMGYHLFLTGRGETTREYLASRRFPPEERHRPFNLGNILENWIAVFGRPRAPTYLHFKKAYEEGDQRFGLRKGKRQALLADEAQGGGLEMKHMEKSFEGPHGRIPKREGRS